MKVCGKSSLENLAHKCHFCPFLRSLAIGSRRTRASWCNEHDLEWSPSNGEGRECVTKSDLDRLRIRLTVPIMVKRSGSTSRHTAASSSVLLSLYIGHLVCACGEFRLQCLVDVKYNQEINKKITGPKRSIDKRIAERKSSFAFLCQQKTRFEIGRETKKTPLAPSFFFPFLFLNKI